MPVSVVPSLFVREEVAALAKVKSPSPSVGITLYAFADLNAEATSNKLAESKRFAMF
jgi:hypothetical protein